MRWGRAKKRKWLARIDVYLQAIFGCVDAHSNRAAPDAM